MTLIVVLTKADDNIRCRYFDEMILIVGLESESKLTS